MIAVLDTNALLQVFGTASPLVLIREALRRGRLELAVSTPLLLEYEEVIRRYSGSARWDDVWRFLTLIDALHGNIVNVRASASIGRGHRCQSIGGYDISECEGRSSETGCPRAGAGLGTAAGGVAG